MAKHSPLRCVDPFGLRDVAYDVDYVNEYYLQKAGEITPLGGGSAVRYRVEIKDYPRCSLTIIVKLKMSDDEDPHTLWQLLAEAAIEDKWNDRLQVCCPKSFPACCCLDVTVDVQWVTEGAHYSVSVVDHDADSFVDQEGNVGMAEPYDPTFQSGIDRSSDMAHEFGHMIGQPEEYGTVWVGTDGLPRDEGFDWDLENSARPESMSVMGNPDSPVCARNLEVLASGVGRDCFARLKNQ